MAETTLDYVIGYEVTLIDGEVRRVTADRYAIGDDGTLQFLGAESVVEQLAPGQWLRVAERGTRLAERWPPENLPLIVETVAERLGVHYGYCVHGLRDMARFEDWRMNDLDAFTAAVFEAVEEDPKSSDIRSWVADVREILARGFHVQQ